MKNTEKDLFQKTAMRQTTGMKPAELLVLSGDRPSRSGDDTSTSSGWIASFGVALKRHRKIISFIQWLFVILYLALLLLPISLANIVDERLYVPVADFCRLVFWGIGWPVIILSMMLFGRVWCGIFCPDGTLTEFISHHGQKRSIPRWIRWKGWPCSVLAGSILYGQLISVYDSFQATLILLAIPTSLALATGFSYGNGKRIWCMYLCPGNGIFSLLARLSPIYYKVDATKWKHYFGQPEHLDCPTLINVSRMQSSSSCHACGRCIGHRNAVELGVRPPSFEILATPANKISSSELFLLLWGIAGICTTSLAWRGNELFAQFLLKLNSSGTSDLPFWLSENPFSIFLVIFILIAGSAIALVIYVLLRLAATVSGHPDLWKRLAFCLIPVIMTGIFLGLCQISLSIWQAHGFQVRWAPIFQSIILAASALFSIWLGIRTIFGRISIVNLMAFCLYCLPVSLLCFIWIVHFQA